MLVTAVVIIVAAYRYDVAVVSLYMRRLYDTRYRSCSRGTGCD